MSIIHVSNLTKQFKDVKAVDNLSFTVEAGDVYGFLGQNGAGKTTTIRMLLTLIGCTSGTIKIFGKELNSNREAILSRVGAMIEKPDLYKYLSAYQNLSVFARLSGVNAGKKKIMEYLDLVGLAARANSKVNTFSQGMKQRLGIAVALVHDPELIILDEPTNGLDPQGIADVRKLIRHLSNDQGKTFVISSHLLTEIELVANRILIIDKGRKIVEGSVDELQDPSKTVVEINTLDNIAAREKLINTSWGDKLQTSGSEYITLQFHKDKIPLLVQDMVAMNIQLLSVEPRNTLEDYFLSLTNPNHVEAAAN